MSKKNPKAETFMDPIKGFFNNITGFFKKEQCFFCYRRDESAIITDILHDKIEDEGKYKIFKDTKDLKAGDQWKDQLKHNVNESSKMLVFIGKNWEDRFNTDLLSSELITIKESVENQRKSDTTNNDIRDAADITLELIKNSAFREQFIKNNNYNYNYNKLLDALNTNDQKSISNNLITLISSSLEILNEFTDYVQMEIEDFLEKREEAAEIIKEKFSKKLDNINEKISSASSSDLKDRFKRRKEKLDNKIKSLVDKKAQLIPIHNYRQEDLNEDKLPDKIKKLVDFQDVRINDYEEIKGDYDELSELLYNGNLSRAFWRNIGPVFESYKMFAALFFIPLLLFLGYSLINQYIAYKGINDKLSSMNNEPQSFNEIISNIKENRDTIFINHFEETQKLTEMKNTLMSIQDSLKNGNNNDIHHILYSKIDHYYENNPGKFLTSNEVDSLLNKHFIGVDDRINNVNLALREIIMQILNDCKPMAKEYIDCSLIDCNTNTAE